MASMRRTLACRAPGAVPLGEAARTITNPVAVDPAEFSRQLYPPPRSSGPRCGHAPPTGVHRPVTARAPRGRRALLRSPGTRLNERTHVDWLHPAASSKDCSWPLGQPYGRA
jgi:hypothetical protein